MRETSARCGPMRLLASTTMTVAASLFGPPSTARLGRDVEIRQAAGGRGRGAFATRTLPAGEYLGRYTGRLMSPAEAYCAYEAGVTTGEYFASLGEAGDGEAPQHCQSALAHSTVKPPWLTAADATTHHSRSPAVCSGLPSGTDENALAARVPKRACVLALWCLPKVTDSTAFDHARRSSWTRRTRALRAGRASSTTRGGASTARM